MAEVQGKYYDKSMCFAFLMNPVVSWDGFIFSNGSKSIKRCLTS